MENIGGALFAAALMVIVGTLFMAAPARRSKFVIDPKPQREQLHEIVGSLERQLADKDLVSVIHNNHDLYWSVMAEIDSRYNRGALLQRIRHAFCWWDDFDKGGGYGNRRLGAFITAFDNHHRDRPLEDDDFVVVRAAARILVRRQRERSR